MIQNLIETQSIDSAFADNSFAWTPVFSRNSSLSVAVVTSFPANPETPIGGVEAVSVNLVRCLAKFTDLKIHVVTTDRFCPKPQVTTWQNASIHRLPWAADRVLSHAIGEDKLRLQCYLDSLSPDLIHSHDFYGIMVAKMALPRVFTIHGFIADDTRLAGKRWSLLRSKLWSMVEHAGWADQPHIIAISPYVREHLRGIAKGTIHDIDNPVSQQFFDVEHTPGSGIVFNAAAICPRKNTLGLIEVFRRLIKKGVLAQLRLAGKTTNTEYERSVRQAIHDAHLDHHVVMLGSIGSEQICKELAVADVFALVSLEEGAPMCIAEAMAAGVPVVTSNRCGMPYMVRDGETGFLVDPENPDDIASHIELVLNNSTLARRMGNLSRQIAMERFHPDRVASRTRDVYLQALAER
jgi:glycosyltransferase involved in cell wall biosynthesis